MNYKDSVTMNKIPKLYFLFFCIIFSTANISGQNEKIDFLRDYNQIWVDSVFQSLTLDQKIGQLLMPRGNYPGKVHDIKKLNDWVENYHIGGLVFFASSPYTQASLTNQLQGLAKTPLLIGQDFEWGLGMRLDSTVAFPYAMTIGAMQGHDGLIYEMGQEVGNQCKRMGVHINYAPVVDININPKNPVINFRSFGENKQAVTDKSLAYMKGMLDSKILCAAKHFPGHGDTDVDSHLDLPIIQHDKTRLSEVELFPFKKLIANGLPGIMIAHLNIPSLEPTAGLASTFSSHIIDDLLKKELGFKGLVISDAMDMKGAIKNYPKGEAMVRALLAGNDILETFMDVPEAVSAIKTAVQEGRISMDVLNAKVLKILKAKSFVGLDRYKPIKLEHLTKDLNDYSSEVLQFKLMSQSITCLQNQRSLIPIRHLEEKIAFVSLDAPNNSVALETAMKYTKNVKIYHLNSSKDIHRLDTLVQELKQYKKVILNVHLSSNRPYKNYGINDQNSKIIATLSPMENVVTCLFGNVYALLKLPEIQTSPTLITTYQDDNYAEDLCMQMVFGAIGIHGKLPVSISEKYPYHTGLDIEPIGRLAYLPGEMVNINGEKLASALDSIVLFGIKEKAYPGCVVEVVKDGVVVYQKAFGNHTYDDEIEPNFEKNHVHRVSDQMDVFDPNIVHSEVFDESQQNGSKMQMDDLFDLASLTKIFASTFALATLESQGKIDIDKPLSYYLPELRQTNKSNLTLRQMLTHTAGLKAWIPFWRHAVDTVSTLKPYVDSHPDIQKYVIQKIIKPSFFKRLFGKKSQIIYDYNATVIAYPYVLDAALKYSKTIWKPGTFSTVQTIDFPIKIHDSLFMSQKFRDSVFAMIKSSPVATDSIRKYVYSDLHFYFYPELIQRITGQRMEDYLAGLYSKMGIHNILYNPNADIYRIVPTEWDSLFRKTLIQGRVHDEGSALIGGVSGHAGLFGTANDLAKLIQLFLQKGKYGEVQYIDSDIISEWTKYQFPENKIRRGVGFDKKDFDQHTQNGPSLFSEDSYGHSGFTGTYFWCDPKYRLGFVFLSNRVYPTRENSKINQYKIRQSIGDAIISSLK